MVQQTTVITLRFAGGQVEIQLPRVVEVSSHLSRWEDQHLPVYVASPAEGEQTTVPSLIAALNRVERGAK